MNARRATGLLVGLLLAALVLAALGVCVGSAGLENLIGPLLDPGADPSATAMAQQIVWEIRLPRTLGAWCAGALLGLAGAVAQGLFRNPLADPFLLGSASGASLGVAMALAAMGGGAGMLGASMMNSGAVVSVFSSSVWVRLGLTGAAFGGAVLAVLLTLVLSRGVQHTLRLLLAGVVVGVVRSGPHLNCLISFICSSLLRSVSAWLLLVCCQVAMAGNNGVHRRARIRGSMLRRYGDVIRAVMDRRAPKRAFGRESASIGRHGSTGPAAPQRRE